ncbi:hypothetical protein MJO29_014717 [Puccinia striiformis f. sp. tritici]|uniref:hypothetical protein n=1 Tax=Puccinia striiformis f. sp. tritici TaxID=168172 RepID=UPI002008EB6A|nr:hypothetical protein Pst134EA_027810 [Puccinia striiformis f. sp. tritici]KAH9448499.1 hypothetical protein Pst134EA_027810 [Puccinia striiformis f. sp. tritici]KAI7937402.1 hypothetical protein MJO29_014717 [Puccinia striiformis f. sp. tritici]
MSHRAASVSLLDQIHITPRERECGWSASLSGVRGLSEQQARRILHFENTLRQHLEIHRPEDALEHDQSSDEFGKIPSGITKHALRTVAARHCRAACAHNPCSSCILKPRASLPEYQRLASSGLNRSLRVSRSQSSFLRFKSPKRSKSQASHWSNESDEFSYLVARQTKTNSDATQVQWEPGFNDGSTVHHDGVTLIRRSDSNTGLRGLFRKVGRALASPASNLSLRRTSQDSDFRGDSSHLYHLSHEMVGSESPFPMRPPLFLSPGHPSGTLDGDWIGVGRNIISESNR